MPKILLLIVEDEADIAELYGAKFEKLGYEVDIAHDGQDGLVKMATEHPALVLMDILMPGLSGEQAVERAKHDPAIKNIPIVMLTNYADSIELRNAMQQGAVDYIVKSETTPSQAVERVKKYLKPLAPPENKKHKYLS